MTRYFVDVLMPFGWWTVCSTDSEQEARAFERKQQQSGAATRFHCDSPSDKLVIPIGGAMS